MSQFDEYERQAERLLQLLQNDEAYSLDAFTLVERLRENISDARLYGDTPDRSAARAQILNELNRMTRKLFGTTFRDLPDLPSSTRPPPGGYQPSNAQERINMPPQGAEPSLSARSEAMLSPASEQNRPGNFWQRLLSSLSHSAWAGIAAIIAIISLILWAIVTFVPAKEPSATATASSKETATLSIPTPEPFAIKGIAFDPPSPSNAKSIKIFSCTQGYGGVGITLKVSINTSPDGTDAGDWQTLKELGVPCFNQDDAPVWDTAEWPAGTYLVKVEAKGPDDPSWEHELRMTVQYVLRKP